MSYSAEERALLEELAEAYEVRAKNSTDPEVQEMCIDGAREIRADLQDDANRKDN